MKTEDLNYDLPEELIAQYPAAQRAQSKLLVLDRSQPDLVDTHFANIGEHLRPGDLLVLNNTKVLPARFYAHRQTGAQLEGLFLGSHQPDQWEVLLKGARKVKINETFLFNTPPHVETIEAQLLERREDGHCIIHVHNCRDPLETLGLIGYAPLPPYIKRQEDPEQNQKDRTRYQTVYAETNGAVAAPTAGLHFTDQLLDQLRIQGIETITLTLHVGIGTFKPVTVDNLSDHDIHSEEIHIPQTCVDTVNQAKDQGRRIIAVGTTSTRALESAAIQIDQGWRLQTYNGATQLFITPGYEFKIIDALITNFHLPKSTLIALVGALTGMDTIMEAYQHAVKEEYRFFSYGDAMLIV